MSKLSLQKGGVQLTFVHFSHSTSTPTPPDNSTLTSLGKLLSPSYGLAGGIKNQGGQGMGLGPAQTPRGALSQSLEFLS